MTVNPDEVVALGAAIQAGVLTGEGPDVAAARRDPAVPGSGDHGRRDDQGYRAQHHRSRAAQRDFSTAEDNQPAVDVVVLQGERETAGDNRTLGRFRLENIRPAPRGVPQIDVTFDVDANGILNVSAKDKDTGAEQTITITESGNLDRSEVERMVAEAERTAARTAAPAQLIDARNELDVRRLPGRAAARRAWRRRAAHEKARAELLINDARQAIKDEAPLDRLRSLTGELQQVAQSLSAAQRTRAGGRTSRSPAGRQAVGPGSVRRRRRRDRRRLHPGLRRPYV